MDTQESKYTIRKHFLTGLALLLPVLFTLLITIFLVDLLTKPFLQMFEDLFTRMGILGTPPYSEYKEQLLTYISQLAALLFLIALTLAVGIFARIFFISRLVKFYEAVIKKIPFVNKIYLAVQEVVHTLLKKDDNRFTKVVLVPYPDENSQAIGLVTNETMDEKSDPSFQKRISVFVPAGPNPTMGFMLLYKPEQVVWLDMEVDQALKIIISCGAVIDKLPSKTAATNGI